MAFKTRTQLAFSLALALAAAACGGGGGGSVGGGPSTQPAFEIAPLGTQSLSALEVENLVARAVQAALDRNLAATIAVTDRVGNVLALYSMTNAPGDTVIRSGLNDDAATPAGLDGFVVPTPVAAISKAITGAYLSSTGNAFSTRTASQIVQEFFQPGERNQPSGPLYGVQFSQLPCSDLNVWLSQSPTLGPKRSPLGLSADPGGFPVYKNGRVVGGIGVMASSAPNIPAQYSLDRNIQQIERDLEEEIAWAALPDTFRPPEQIKANRITVNGQTFQFTNAQPPAANPANLLGNGNYFSLPGYKATVLPVAGVAYGAVQSGYAPASQADFPGLNAYQLTASANEPAPNRYPPAAGSQMTQAEVQAVLAQAIAVANRTRAQIRAPLGSPAEVTVSVVDLSGRILGVLRTSDAPIFGTDVSLQKARAALAFSSPGALGDFTAMDAGAHTAFANAMNGFFDQQASVLDGTVAFSARAIGNAHRPFFPDGDSNRPKGPLSTSVSDMGNRWSPFNVGFQLDIVAGRVLGNLLGENRPSGVFTPPATTTCADTANLPPSSQQRFANGLQIFPGGYPIYKGNTLVGGIGVSGDGIDQDEMIGYLGVLRAGQTLGTPIRPFPANLRRADNLSSGGQFLKYIQCPQAPFIDSAEQNVCPLP